MNYIRTVTPAEQQLLVSQKGRMVGIEHVDAYDREIREAVMKAARPWVPAEAEDESAERLRRAMPDELIVRRNDGVSSLYFAFRYFDVDGWVISIPAGYTTDFASTPRWLWWWLPPHGKYERAAVVHDWLCTNQGRVWVYGGPNNEGPKKLYFNSDQAAGIFHDCMELLGVWSVRRRLMTAAVAKFGPRF